MNKKWATPEEATHQNKWIKYTDAILISCRILGNKPARQIELSAVGSSTHDVLLVAIVIVLVEVFA
jgi:hypothetical protein